MLVGKLPKKKVDIVYVFLWVVGCSLTKGTQLIGFNSQFIYGDVGLTKNESNVLDEWPIRNENGYYNYDLYQEKENYFLTPIEGIYYFSANLIIEAIDNTDIYIYYKDIQSSFIYCQSFKRFTKNTRDTLSLSCFVRIKRLVRLNLVVNNTENVNVLIGSSIGLQYVGLPGIISSFVLPLDINDRELVVNNQKILNTFKYYNSLAVIEDLGNITISCTSLYFISVNAVVRPGKDASFSIIVSSGFEIINVPFDSDAGLQTIVLLKAIHLYKGQSVVLKIDDLYILEKSIYTILKLDHIDSESNYVSLPITPRELTKLNYTYGQHALEMPVISVEMPYFINVIQFSERIALQLQNGGLYLVSIDLLLFSEDEINVAVVLNTEYGLDISEIDESSGFTIAYKNKIPVKSPHKLQLNGVLELKKKSILSLIIISKNNKKLKILRESSILLFPVPLVAFQGDIKIKELEKNVLICSKDGNLITGYKVKNYADDMNIKKQTFLNKYVSVGRNSYVIPTAGLYYISIKMIISSANSQNGNITMNILVNKTIYTSKNFLFSIFSNYRETVKIVHIANLKKDFEIQLKINCETKLQIQDGISFNIILLKSTAKAVHVSLPLSPNNEMMNLENEVITGTFSVQESGIYMITIEQRLLYENLKEGLNYITIYCYEQSKGKDTGTGKRQYITGAMKNDNGGITVQLIDIIELKKDVDIIVLVELTKKDSLLKVFAVSAKCSFYKFSSFYGFKAKQNSPKLLSLIGYQVSIGNLQFNKVDGGFKLPFTNFFGRTNFIVYKTMTMFYVVLIEALDLKVGSIKLAFLLRPSGRYVVITPFTKGKSWTLLEAYGTLDLDKGEIVQLVVESNVAERILISKSSWAMMELTDPSIPMDWIDKKHPVDISSAISSDVYITVSTDEITLTNATTVKQQSPYNTYWLTNKLLTGVQWNGADYKQNHHRYHSNCTVVLISIQSLNRRDLEAILTITSSTGNVNIPFLPLRYNYNCILLCLNDQSKLSLNVDDIGTLSVAPLSNDHSIESFSSLVTTDIQMDVGSEFTRINGWTTASSFFFKETSGFKDSKGVYYVQENGYYIVNIAIKIKFVEASSSCFFMLLKDEVYVTSFKLESLESFLYNNVLWFQRYNAIQIGLECKTRETEVIVKRHSVFGIYLIDSQPTFNSKCINVKADLLTSVNKSTIFIQSNKNFTIHCSNHLNSIADFYWYKDNEVVQELIGGREGKITLSNVTEEDNGVYVCESETGMIRKSSKSIQLMVIDPTPVISLSNDTVFVEENYVANKLLIWLKLEAKNPETNRPARVALSIIEGDPTNNFYFTPSIANSFSTISYILPFNFESEQVYRLVIQAENIDFHSGSKAVSVTELRVIVVNRNDNQPVFSKDSLQFKLAENIEIGYKVCTVKTIDLDLTEGDKIQYGLLVTKSSPLFKISDTTGDITVNGAIDYEATPFIHLICSVYDGTFTSFKPIEIQVVDVNDNRPTFTEHSFQVNITTEIKVDDELLELTAIDLDSGVYGEITYSILDGNNENFFRIQNKSIVLNKIVTSEERFQLYVTAVDGGNLYCFNPAFVNINVIDVTSVKIPVFKQQLYEATLDENIEVPVQIVDVKVKITKSHVIYKIREIPYNKQYASILQNGTIILQKAIDYEEMRYLNVIVSACTIHKKKEVCGTSYLTVGINDINDNRPLFTKSFYNVIIKSKLNVGSLVAKVFAEDKDLNENGKFRYILHDHKKYFQINQLDGSITLIKTFNQSYARTFKLYVEARDNGQPSLSSHCYVNINIEKYSSFQIVTPLEVTKKQDTPLISNWLFWLGVVAILLLVVVPFIIIAIWLRYKRMKNEMAERIKSKDKSAESEMKGLMSYLSRPAESVECVLSFSCETLPSAYSSKKHLKMSTESVNGVIVHSADVWDGKLLLNDVDRDNNKSNGV